MLRSFVKSICVAEHRQPVIHVGRAQATSYTRSLEKNVDACVSVRYVMSTRLLEQLSSYTTSPSKGNQLYRQPKYRQPVIRAAQAQATSYTDSPSACNQLYTPSLTSECPSPSTGNQLYILPKRMQAVIYTQRKHRQPVIHPAHAQTTRFTFRPSTDNQLHRQPKHMQPVIQTSCGAF